MRILLVCSSGGHLLQLHNLKPWRERHDGMWVTFEKLDSKSLLAGESVTWAAHHPTNRNLRALAQDFTLAWRLLRSTSLTSSSPAAPGWPYRSSRRSSVASVPGASSSKVVVRSGSARPLLLATVGTNHHPFDRLVR